MVDKRVKLSSAEPRRPQAAPHAFIASALRTIETEGEGLAALSAAMCDGLGAAFVAAVDAIRQARGRRA